MLLHADPSLAEVPGFRKEQLDALARSVELRRQQLEDDINDYIKAKQHQLRAYGDEVRLRRSLPSTLCAKTDSGLACRPVPLNGMRPAIRLCRTNHYQ